MRKEELSDRVNSPFNQLGGAIRQRRRELGLTQGQIAELSGVGIVFIVDVEAGKRTVRLDRLIMLMSTLGLRFRVEEGQGGIKVTNGLG